MRAYKLWVVTGSRDGYAGLITALDERAQAWGCPANLFVGDCPTGVDAEVLGWCRAQGIHAHVFCAAPKQWKTLRAWGGVTAHLVTDWGVEGKRAGMLRNCAMVDSAAITGTRSVVLLGFPSLGGRGTQGCMEYARRAAVTVWQPDDTRTQEDVRQPTLPGL